MILPRMTTGAELNITAVVKVVTKLLCPVHDISEQRRTRMVACERDFLETVLALPGLGDILGWVDRYVSGSVELFTQSRGDRRIAIHGSIELS